MRIVFDTNVLLSGLFTRGLCEALLDVAFESGEHTVVTSEYVLDEFARHALRAFRCAPERIEETLAWLRAHVEIVPPLAVAADACRDPKDLPILGTALAGQADCVVTGDADLLDIGAFQGIPILSPRGFHDRLI